MVFYVWRECKHRNKQEIAWALMYADDSALVTESMHQMQAAIELADKTFAQWGLELSIKKTKVMGIGVDVSVPIILDRGQIEAVKDFRYLGSVSSSDNSMQSELAARLSKAGAAFYRLNKLWRDAHLARHVKLSIYKTVVLATLLYGCETWAASQLQVCSLQTFHMRCLRKICRISLWQRKTNDEIMALAKVESIATLVRYRRLRWLGHMARMDDSRLPKKLLFGGIEQNSVSVGRPPKSWQDYVREDLAMLKMSYDWFRVAQKRNSWRSRIQGLLTHT